MGDNMADNSGSMTCKQLFNHFSSSSKKGDQSRLFRQDRQSYEELEDDETMDSPKRTKFLDRSDSQGDGLGYDSDD